MNVESNEINEQYDASQININLDILQAKLDSNEDLAGLKDEITGLTDNKEVLSERLEEYNYQNIIKKFINEVDTNKPVDEQKDQIDNFEAKKNCLQVFVALNVLGGVYQGAINKSMIIEGDVTTLDKDKVRGIVDSKDTSSFQGVLDSVDPSIFDSTEGKIFNWLSDNRESSFVTDLISESDYSEMQSVMQESMYGQDDKEGLIDAYQERMNMNMFNKMMHYGENAIQRAQYYAEEGIEECSKKAKELSEWAKNNPKKTGYSAGGIALGYMLIKKVFGEKNSSGGLLSSVTGWMKNNKLLTVLGGTGVFFGLNKFLGGTANAENNNGIDSNSGNLKPDKINNDFENLNTNDKEKYNKIGSSINSLYDDIFDSYNGEAVKSGQLGNGTDRQAGAVPYAIDQVGNIEEILNEGIEGQMSGLLSLDKDQLFDRLKNMPKSVVKELLFWFEDKVGGGLNYLSESIDGLASMPIDKFSDRLDENGKEFIEENIDTIKDEEIKTKYQDYFRKYSRSIVYLQNTRERLYYQLVKEKLDNPTESEIKNKLDDENWLEENGIIDEMDEKFYHKDFKDLPEQLEKLGIQDKSLEDQNTYISKTVGDINKIRDRALDSIDEGNYEKVQEIINVEIDGLLDSGIFADLMTGVDESDRQEFIQKSGLSNRMDKFKESLKEEFESADNNEKKEIVKEFFAIKKEIDTGIGITTKLVEEGEDGSITVRFASNTVEKLLGSARSGSGNAISSFYSYMFSNLEIGLRDLGLGDKLKGGTRVVGSLTAIGGPPLLLLTGLIKKGGGAAKGTLKFGLNAVTRVPRKALANKIIANTPFVGPWIRSWGITNEAALKANMLTKGLGLSNKNAFEVYKALSDADGAYHAKFVSDFLGFDSVDSVPLKNMIKKGDWDMIDKMLGQKFIDKDALLMDIGNNMNVFKNNKFFKRNFTEFVLNETTNMDDALDLYNKYAAEKVDDIGGFVRKAFVNSDNFSSITGDSINPIVRILDSVDGHDFYSVIAKYGDNVNDWNKFADFVDGVSNIDSIGGDEMVNIIKNASMEFNSIDFSKTPSKIIDDYGLKNTLQNTTDNINNKLIRFIENGLTDSVLMDDVSKAKIAGSIDDYNDFQKFARVADGADGVDEMVTRHILYEYGGDIDKVDDVSILKKQAMEYLNMHQASSYANLSELELADNIGDYTNLLRNGDDVNSLAVKILNNWEGANSPVQMQKAKAYADYIIDGAKKGNIVVDGVDIKNIYRTSSEARVGLKKALSQAVSNENGYVNVGAFSSNKVSKSIDSSADTIKLSNKTETLDVQKTSDNLVDILDNGLTQKEINAFQKAINQKGDIFKQMGDHILSSPNMKSKLVKANSIDEIKAIFNSVDDVNLGGISDDALEVFVKTDSVEQIDTLAKISKNSQVSDLAIWGTKVSSILVVLGLVADVYYGVSQINGAKKQQDIYSKYNINRANIEGQRVGMHGVGMGMDITGSVLGTKAIMSSILGGTTPAGRIGLGIVGASHGIRSVGDNVLDVRSSYYRNYQDYKKKHETEIKNSIIALQASKEGVDVGTYNKIEEWSNSVSFLEDPNIDELDLKQTQKYASQALVHFDVAESIEMGWLVSDRKRMKKQIELMKGQKEDIKSQKEGKIKEFYLSKIENEIEKIRKQRAKFEAQVQKRSEFINNNLEQYIESFDSFDGFNNIDRLIRDSKIYEREKRVDEGWIDKMSTSYPMFLNDLVDYDVLDLEDLNTEWQTFNIDYDSSKHFKLEKSASFELKKVKGQYRKNNNGELELKIDNVDIPGNNMKNYNKIEWRVSSGEFVEQGQTIIVNKQDIDMLERSQEYDYRSKSRKYMFSYDTEESFDFDKSKQDFKENLQNPNQMGLENIPENAYEKLNQLYQKYPIEFKRMTSSSFEYFEDYPDRVRYLLEFMNYKESYPTIQGDLNEKQTQDMHSFDIRTTNNIEKFIQNFELAENGYNRDEFKEGLDSGMFELYTSSSIENDLGWSDSPVQNVIYRIACEVHDYDGNNKMIELQNFFSKDEMDNRGIYYDGTHWNIRTVGVGFKGKKIKVDPKTNPKDWIQGLKTVLNNESGDLVSLEENAGQGFISDIMREQMLDILNQEKKLVDNKKNIKNDIQKYIQGNSNNKYIQLPMDMLIKATRAGISNIGKYMYRYENGKVKAITHESISKNGDSPSFIDELDNSIEGSQLKPDEIEYIKHLDDKKAEIMNLYESHKKSVTYEGQGLVPNKVSLAPDKDFQNYFESMINEYDDFKNHLKTLGDGKRKEKIEESGWDNKLESIHIALLSLGEPDIQYDDRKIFDFLSQPNIQPVSINFENGDFEVRDRIQNKFDNWLTKSFANGLKDKLKNYTKQVGIKDGKLVYVGNGNYEDLRTIDDLENIEDSNKDLTQKGYNAILKSIIQKELDKSPNLGMEAEIRENSLSDLIKINIDKIR